MSRCIRCGGPFDSTSDNIEICFHCKQEMLKPQCPYCDREITQVRIDTKCVFEGMKFTSTIGLPKIRYCPMCGRKLEDIA